MILLSWMAYAIMLSAFVTVAAMLGERALRWSFLPARFVWLFAMFGSCVLPLVLTRNNEARTTAAVLVEPASLLDERLTLAVWAVAILAVAGSIVFGALAVRRQRRQWRNAQLSGERVWLSASYGPGVLALGKPRIVVPSWTLELSNTQQELLIAHEREHVRARDPWLLLSALFALVLFPFNPLLWWQYRRLKLAIEMDCDARVLAGRRNVREYAALLLDVGRRCSAGHLPLAAFAAPPHSLERRIRMMVDPHPKARRLLISGAIVSAICVIAVACMAPDAAGPDTVVRAALQPDPSRAVLVEVLPGDVPPAPDAPPPPPAPLAPESRVILDGRTDLQALMVEGRSAGRPAGLKPENVIVDDMVPLDLKEVKVQGQPLRPRN